ncbi:MAG TPA: transposase [Candidatus Dormibacteraeota bacterium]
MLPLLNLPVSLLSVLVTVRPCFTAPSFTTFSGLAAGLAGQVRRRTVVGMLLGACLQRAWPHDRAHYFFSRARWQLDEVGLAVAGLVADALIDPGADVTVALDDSVCVRAGRKVHGTGWQHDGSAKNLQKLSFGNCFVTVGIVVQLPFCSRAWCLPVLARLHLPGKGAGPSKVTVAAELVALLADAFPGRRLNVVADAAYHGPALRDLPANVTWTCRLPRTAVLYGLAPPRTGRRGRPRTKGERLGTPADLARNATWTTDHVVTYHGRTDIRHTATVRCLWYGSFHARAVTVVLVRDEATTSGYDLALVTTDDAAAAGPALIVSRYAMRWPVEQAFADARNVLGAGEARNRTRLAVERTVPFALLMHTLIVIWYARHGYDQADIDARRDDQPWYGEKTEPAFEDMLIKLRRVIIAARFSPAIPAQPTTDEIRAVTSAWDAAAA